MASFKNGQDLTKCVLKNAVKSVLPKQAKSALPHEIWLTFHHTKRQLCYPCTQETVYLIGSTNTPWFAWLHFPLAHLPEPLLREPEVPEA